MSYRRPTTPRHRAADNKAQLLTTKDLAQRWQVKETTVRQLVRDDVVSSYRLHGRIRFTWQQLYAAEGRDGSQVPEIQQLLTRAQVAARYGVKPGTVNLWQRQGKLIAIHVTSKIVRFSVDACEAFERSNLRHSLGDLAAVTSYRHKTMQTHEVTTE